MESRLLFALLCVGCCSLSWGYAQEVDRTDDYEDYKRYEKEVKLACETSLKDSSKARQLVAVSLIGRINTKLGQLRDEIEKTNLKIKSYEELDLAQNEKELEKAQKEYQAHVRRYQISISDGNMGRDPAAIEETLGKLRDSQKKVQTLEENGRKLSITSSESSEVKPLTKKQDIEQNYQSLERLVKSSDQYQGLLNKASDCAFRKNNVGTQSEVEVPGSQYKRRSSE